MSTKVYESIIWLIILMTSCAVCQVWAFPSGGPTYSCRNLIPGHSNGTQQGMPPYRISVSRQTLEAGRRTRVSVESTTDFPFLGFICAVSELMDEKNETVGTMSQTAAFQQSNLLKSVNCARSTPDTAVTHTSREEKWRVEFDWMSPMNAMEGQRYKLRCSVVQSFFRCWTNIQTTLTVTSSNDGGIRNGINNSASIDTTTASRGNSFGPMQNTMPPVTRSNGRNANNANTARQDPGNNSVSQGGALRQTDNNLLSNNFRITESNNDINRRPNITPTLVSSDSAVNVAPRAPFSVSDTRANSGRSFIQNTFSSNSIASNGDFTGDVSSGFPTTSRDLSQIGSPPNAVRVPDAINQIANPPQTFPNSISGLNRNQINNANALSDFEQAIILELLALGINPLATIDNRFQRQRPNRLLNNNVAGRNFNNVQNFENQLSSLNLNRNPSVPRSTNSRFQDTSLIRSDTMVFDPFSVQSPFRRNTAMNNPNGRGLFQSTNSNTRTFNPVFSRIRRRNK